MHDFAGMDVGDRSETDMRVRPHVEFLGQENIRRRHIIEKDERPDHLPVRRGQHAADRQAATKVARPRHQDRLNQVGGAGVAEWRIDGGQGAHGGLSVSALGVRLCENIRSVVVDR